VGESPLFIVQVFLSDMPSLERDELLRTIVALGEQAVSGTSIEIADIELRGSGKARLLRVYIDKPGGVSHGDCELVSTQLGALLDEQDAMPGESYTLEVSSPGVERALKKPRDFERVIGKRIKVVLREPLEGQKRVEGKLQAINENAIDLEVAPGESRRIVIEQIQKANLKFEW
jgi:ribosome maturation factor RimP